MSTMNKNYEMRLGSSQVTSTGLDHTFEGGFGVVRDPKSELFITAVSTMVEDTFYESRDDRIERLRGLVTQVATDGPWMIDFITWLRDRGMMRTVSTLIAAMAVKARLDEGIAGDNRAIVQASIRRLDEVAEFIAAWTQLHGRTIPSAVKRGVNDALHATLTERSFLKWKGRAKRGAYSLADVINLTHPRPRNEHDNALFQAVIDDAYGNPIDTTHLPTIAARQRFLGRGQDDQMKDITEGDIIREAALTHEVIAGVFGKIPALAWEKLVPTMGYMALRMNLRRISDAGVSAELIRHINDRLVSEQEITKARQFPLSFYIAYYHAPLEFAAALQQATNFSLSAVPHLKGRTLILVDASGSMAQVLSQRSDVTLSMVARLFGVACARKTDHCDVYSFDQNVYREHVRARELFRTVDRMREPDGWTDIGAAVRATYAGHDRVIVITDEQTTGQDVYGSIPSMVPVYTWNLGGYRVGAAPDGPGRITFAGLTDAAFSMIPIIENGRNGRWPWQ